MKIDFYAADCREETREQQFGICDGPGDSKAFISTNDDDKWVAIVQNATGQKLDFHSIDGCIRIVRSNSEQEKRCDAMLCYPDNIVFVELKEVMKGGWIKEGVEQLKRTIEVFSAHHDLTAIGRRRAFLANRRQPSFKFSHKETMERFMAETSVRLIIFNEIKI